MAAVKPKPIVFFGVDPRRTNPVEPPMWRLWLTASAVTMITVGLVYAL